MQSQGNIRAARGRFCGFLPIFLFLPLFLFPLNTPREALQVQASTSRASPGGLERPIAGGNQPKRGPFEQRHVPVFHARRDDDGNAGLERRSTPKSPQRQRRRQPPRRARSRLLRGRFGEIARAHPDRSVKKSRPREPEICLTSNRPSCRAVARSLPSGSRHRQRHFRAARGHRRRTPDLHRRLIFSTSRADSTSP
jgi:hypothetical protein